MEAALVAWLRTSPTALTNFKNRPLEMVASSPDIRGHRTYHPAAPGRWYCAENRLDGPAHHSRKEWETAIARALAIFEAERAHQPVRHNYPSRRRYSKNWHLPDYPGKHGPEFGPDSGVSP